MAMERAVGGRALGSPLTKDWARLPCGARNPEGEAERQSADLKVPPVQSSLCAEGEASVHK